MITVTTTTSGFTTSESTQLELIRLTLATVVPISIANLQQIGGAQDYHIKEVQRRMHETQGAGEGMKWSGFADMFFGGKQSAAEMTLLCDMVAVMAFCPGGITTFGLHFEAEPEPEPPAQVDPGDLPPWPDVEPPLQPPAQPEEAQS